MPIVEELRSKKSRDNRELLDRAADEIAKLGQKVEQHEKAKYVYANVDYCAEDLVIELKKNERLQAEVDLVSNELKKARVAAERLQAAYDGLVADVKTCGVRDVCFICKAYNSQPDCECDCMECKLDCPCRECRECSHWKWRGEE